MRIRTVRPWVTGGGGRAFAALGLMTATITIGPSFGALTATDDQRTGMWVSADELALLPVSGGSWQSVVSAASVFDSSMVDYGWQDSTDGTHALAAALVAARTGDQSLRAEVADAIDRIVSAGYVTDRNPSALGWARSMTAWIVAGDVIDLAGLRPESDVRWREFLTGMPTYPYPGDGGDHLLDLAASRANNIGAVARTAVTAIAIYTGDGELLQYMAELYRAWVEGSAIHRFDWSTSRDRSWQCEPDDPASYRGINPAGCVRDGNDLGGVIADDYRRSGSYDAADFPGENTTKYPWEALGAAIVQAELLRRAGFDEALEWGERAPLRALERLHHLHQIASQDGWSFGRAAGGGSDDRWIIPLINGLYASDYPEPSATGHGRPLSWTDWTHN